MSGLHVVPPAQRMIIGIHIPANFWLPPVEVHLEAARLFHIAYQVLGCDTIEFVKPTELAAVAIAASGCTQALEMLADEEGRCHERYAVNMRASFLFGHNRHAGLLPIAGDVILVGDLGHRSGDVDLGWWEHYRTTSITIRSEI